MAFVREKASRQREHQENMTRMGGVEGELERLTRQRRNMMGEFEDVLGAAEEELEEERRKSLSAEELAEEELQSSMAQLGGTHEEELERLRASYNRRRRSMMVEYEDALGAAEELTERVAELEAEISAMRDISAARDAAARDGTSAMQTAMEALSGKLHASDVHKDRLATRSQQKRFLTRVLLEWRRATRHDKLAREIDTTKAQQEALKERRALEKCLTTGSRRAFFGWKALREQAMLERRAEQQQAEKATQEKESAAAMGEVEGELERLRKRRRSMMLEYEEALEEADTLGAKADMLGAKVESQEAKAMKQKEARAPTPDPTPTLALSLTQTQTQNPDPNSNPKPNPDSGPNAHPKQAILLRMMHGKELAFLGVCLRSWRRLCTQKTGWQAEKAELEQALRVAQTSKDAEVRRVEKLQWEARLEAQARTARATSTARACTRLYTHESTCTHLYAPVRTAPPAAPSAPFCRLRTLAHPPCSCAGAHRRARARVAARRARGARRHAARRAACRGAQVRACHSHAKHTRPRGAQVATSQQPPLAAPSTPARLTVLARLTPSLYAPPEQAGRGAAVQDAAV